MPPKCPATTPLLLLLFSQPSPHKPIPIPKVLLMGNSFLGLTNKSTHFHALQASIGAWLATASPSHVPILPPEMRIDLNLVSGHLSLHSEPADCCHFSSSFLNLSHTPKRGCRFIGLWLPISRHQEHL